MFQLQQQKVLDFALGNANAADLQDCGLNVNGDPEYVRQELLQAIHDKDDVAVECVLILVFKFGGAAKSSDLLAQLLVEEWHRQHENIALILKDLKDPAVMPYLVEVMDLQFPYLDYDGGQGLKTKTIVALGAIGTPESIRALKGFVNSEKKSVADTAKRELCRLRQVVLGA